MAPMVMFIHIPAEFIAEKKKNARNEQKNRPRPQYKFY